MPFPLKVNSVRTGYSATNLKASPRRVSIAIEVSIVPPGDETIHPEIFWEEVFFFFKEEKWEPGSCG